MTFDLEKTIQYWQKGAKYDLGVADAMFKSKKYPYALPKAHAPFSHSLPCFH